MATRWHDPEDGAGNCQPQCARCNLFDQGRQWLYGQRLNEHERGRAEEIMRDAGRTRPYGMEELRALVERYKSEAQRQLASTPALAKRPAKGATYIRTQREKAADVSE